MIGQDPGATATQPTTEGEHIAEHEAPNALVLMRWCDSNLIDPKFRPLVGMNVMNRRNETRNPAGVECDNKVMARIVQELGS